MIKYVIRLAEAEDIERIQQLSQELMEYEKNNSTKEYMYNMNWALTEQAYNNYKSNIENDWIYVACVDNKIVGYMTCWINKKRPWLKYDVLEIGNLYIVTASYILLTAHHTHIKFFSVCQTKFSIHHLSPLLDK